MESGLSSRQQTRFQNARNTKNIDTPISVARQMLLSGLKNSLDEFALALSSKVHSANEDENVTECIPDNRDNVDVLVIVPVETTNINESSIERLFRQYIIDKTINHPYDMKWQRTSHRNSIEYYPSISLEDIDVSFDENTIIVAARVNFNFI